MNSFGIVYSRTKVLTTGKVAPLRILLYGLNYSPEPTGIGKYTGEMAAWLSERGHEVRVVTAPPYYPAWKISDGYRGEFYQTERIPGAPVVFRAPLYVPSKPNGIKRIVHLTSFMLSSIPVMFREIFKRPDVVFAVAPTLFGVPMAMFVASAAGSASWLHVQDFEVDVAFDLGLLPARRFVQSTALLLERLCFRAFSRVSSISARMVERCCAKGVHPERAVLFPNWVDTNHIFPLTGPNRFRSIYGLCDKTVVLYSGNMGYKQGLELLGPLAKAFAAGGTHADPKVHFLFCGAGAFKAQIEELVEKLTNVTLIPLVDSSAFNELLNAADVHLLPQRAGAADLVMPSKLTGMLASGRPVIATADAGTQVAQVIANDSSPCGFVVPAEDPAALHQAVARLVVDGELCSFFGANARQYALRHFGREEVLRQFERDLFSIIPTGEPHPQVN